METTVKTLEFNYQATCECGWKALPTLMKHRATTAADTHHALWHTDQPCSA